MGEKSKPITGMRRNELVNVRGVEERAEVLLRLTYLGLQL